MSSSPAQPASRIPVEGTIAFGGRNLAGLPASRFRETGIGYVSADRAGEGLCLTASVRDNFVAGREREPVFSRFGLLRRAAIDAEARKALARLNVRFGSLGDPAGSLSGGNQQRLAIARELEREPKLLVAAQPTRGVDIAGTAFIHRLLAAFRDRGGAVLLVSESLDEILALSDRIVCIFKGRIVGELGRDQSERRRARAHDARSEGGMIGGAALPGLGEGVRCSDAPFAVAIAIGAVILAVTGHEPVSVYRLMIEEAFGGERRIAATLTEATPLAADGARRRRRLPGRRVQCRGRRLLLPRRHRRGGRRLQSSGLAQSAAHSLRSRGRLCRRRRVAARAWPAARAARSRRSRNDADAELHRDRPDELARRRAAAGARVGQLRNPAHRRRRGAAASPAADHAPFRLSHQPRAGRRDTECGADFQ